MESFLKLYEKVFPHEIQELRDVSGNFVKHPVFRKLNTIENIRTYAEYQVWCVWDFMSVMKYMQNAILSSSTLWLPPVKPNAGSAFYKLIESEETDVGYMDGEQNRASHFQSFILAMKQMGADVSKINHFVELLKVGSELDNALITAGASEKTSQFIITNQQLSKASGLNAIALIMLLRENFLPLVFEVTLENLNESEQLELFIWYHKRHIFLDTNVHGPLSIQIIKEFLTEPNSVLNGVKACISSLNARYDLLDEINNNLK
jgi:hypothetical protein